MGHPATQLTFCDGQVGALCSDASLLVTTPNADYIPEITDGFVTVQLRADCLYAHTDPLLWPQIHTEKYPYLAAVPKTRTPPQAHWVMWSMPTLANFLPLTGTPVKGFGNLSPSFLSPLQSEVAEMSTRVRAHLLSHPPSAQREQLRWHELAMRQALSRLRHLPATFDDQRLQVKELQRHWIMAHAFLEYHQRMRAVAVDDLPPQYDPMAVGAWSSNPAVVQRLHLAGLPVWFVRSPQKVDTTDVRILREVQPSLPQCSVTPFRGLSPAYRGLAGERHLDIMFQGAATYHDLGENQTVRASAVELFCAPVPERKVAISSTATSPSTGTRASGAVRTHAVHASRVRGSNGRARTVPCKASCAPRKLSECDNST